MAIEIARCAVKNLAGLLESLAQRDNSFWANNYQWSASKTSLRFSWDGINKGMDGMGSTIIFIC